MSYIGNPPAEAYTNTVKDTFSGDGSTTAFTMSQISLTNDVRVVVENVVQDPTVAYSCAGTTLTFTSAPPTGTNNIYVVHLGPAVMTALPPAEIAQATTFNSNVSVGGNLIVDTNTLYVDSTNNNVGIGMTSPDNRLSIASGSDSTGVGDGIAFYGSNSNKQAAIESYNAGSYNGDLRFYTVSKGSASTSVTERVRIDSSGNLLVGKTSAAYNTDGFEARPNGETYVSRSGTPMAINRNSSDGTLLNFYKDGSGVGSIGTLSSRLHIENGDTGLRIAGDLDQIFPCGSGGGDRDAAIDLGSTGVRFKDLYLSGGVFLGGVGSSNKLDDYEEGTWTPSLGGTATYNFQSGFYTKVGRQVTLVFYMDVASIGTGSTSTITGAPFSSTTFAPASGAISRFANTAASYVSAFGQIDSSSITIVGKTSASTSTASLSPFQNGTAIYMTITYFTS
jgi:hypothetical protein